MGKQNMKSRQTLRIGAFHWKDRQPRVKLSQTPCNYSEKIRQLLAGLGIEAMDQQRRLRVVDQRQVGEDIRLLLRP